MFHKPEFVFVGETGVPRGYGDARKAIEALDRYARVHRFYMQDRGEKERLTAIDTYIVEQEGELHHFEYIPDSGPRLGAVVHNKYGHPLEYFANYHFESQKSSREYVRKAIMAWELREGPRVGDAIIQPKSSSTLREDLRDQDERMTRFTQNVGDGMQTGGGSGSYHMSPEGFVSYSGGLDRPIPFTRIEDTGHRRWGQFWFFLDGWAGAHRGVYFVAPIRVYKELPIHQE